MGLDRRRALWALKALGEPPLPLFSAAEDTAVPTGGTARDATEWRLATAPASEARAMTLLPEMPLGEHVVEDYATLSLTLKRHPLAFLRVDSPVKVWSRRPTSLICRLIGGCQSRASC